MFADEVVGYAVGLIPSGFYLVLGEKDLNGFIHQLVKSLGIILAIVIVKSIKNYVSQVLNLTWRQLLTRAVHRLYYTGINYYELNVFDKFIDNPYLKLSQIIPQILVLTFFSFRDQRITADINILCLVYSKIAIKLVISPFTISYYTYKAYIGYLTSLVL